MLQIIVCGYSCDDTYQRCLDSIAMQTYTGRTLLTISIDKKENRKYLLKNTIDSIESAKPKPEDIIICIDADDFLCDENAFKIIDDTYSANPDLLLTYGSYCKISTNERGKFCGPYGGGEDFRIAEWRGSHLKTFKYKLFKKVPDVHYRSHDNCYYRCCADRAMMIPMMELAGHDRIKWIETIMYCYNDLNPINVWKTKRELSVATRDLIKLKNPLPRIEKI